MGYTKYHVSWGVDDSLSGAALNHIESQWDYIKLDADLHEHNSRYYTKTSADDTFFALTTSVSLAMDADLLDGQHFSDLLAAVMPLGAIMIWSGTDGTVPSGWHICDGGAYGGLTSPDLRDRFVIGAGGDYAVGATGGPATWNGTIPPTGTVTIGSHTLAADELPSHVHGYVEYYHAVVDTRLTGGSTPTTVVYTSRSAENQDEGSPGQSHGHTGSTAAINAVDPRPKYYSLYYIMKYV